MTDSRKEEKGFELVSKFQPQGDQISAIQELSLIHISEPTRPY